MSLSLNAACFTARLKALLVKYRVYAIILAVCYAAGIVWGCFINRSGTLFDYFGEYADNYYAVVLSVSSGALNIFFIRVFNNLGFILLAFLFGLCIYTAPLQAVVLIYRGIVLSFGLIVFTCNYGALGSVIFIFLILPQHLISTACIIVTAVCGLEHSLIKHRHRCNRLLGGYVSCAAIMFALSLIGALCELLMLVLLLRPLSFFF